MAEKKEKEVVSESDKIWEEIKNLPIEMFSLSNQCVKHHVQRMKVSSTELYLKLKSGAVINSLEAALARARGKQYEVEVTDSYVIVRRGAPALTLPKPEPSEQ